MPVWVGPGGVANVLVPMTVDVTAVKLVELIVEVD